MLRSAREYIARGWHVFPLHSVDDDGACTCGIADCSDAGKHPRIPRGLKKASVDPDQIEMWFGPDAPPSNIAIRTGEVSGVTVFDIDPGKGGRETWAEAVAQKGEPHTLIARTGSGGMHILFQYNSALRTAGNVLGPGVDVRNDGGYIVAPPSYHASGGVYKWLDEDVPLAVLPAHLSQRRDKRAARRKAGVYQARYSLEQVVEMLEVVPADDRDLWRAVGIILGREFDRSDAAWSAYVEWASKWGGAKGRNHDEIMTEAFHVISTQGGTAELSVGTIVKHAIDNGWAPSGGKVPISSLIYYAPGNNYVHTVSGEFWSAAAVDSMVAKQNAGGRLVKASEWLKRNRAATTMTCDPLIDEMLIEGYDVSQGCVEKSTGGTVYNYYKRPNVELGDARLAGPFVSHLHKVFDKTGDAVQFLNYMAHLVQRPGVKPRFALIIAGPQGTGKDTAVEFCTPAIGEWNCASISPADLESGFNEWQAKTLVRINEAADTRDFQRRLFTERTKVLISGTPDHAMINPKYGQKHVVRMFCGVIITTNHLSTGLHIPDDDRRYDVIETATLAQMGLSDHERRREYFNELWSWFAENGREHVAALLHEWDLSGFDPANGQRRTQAHRVASLSDHSEDEWLVNIIEELGAPDALPGFLIRDRAVAEGHHPKDIARKMKAALERQGYVRTINGCKDGMWRVNGKRTVVYVRGSFKGNVQTALEYVRSVF